jgi:hypothetical protein
MHCLRGYLRVSGGSPTSSFHENPDGTHRKAIRHEGPAHLRPGRDEPQGRKETVPRGVRHIAMGRRGA